MIRYAIYMILLGLSACTGFSEDYGPQFGEPDRVDPNVIVINEGTFNFGNASVSGYNTFSGVTGSRLFQTKNGRPLGDVAQSMYVQGDTGWIVVNNSGKIEVVLLPDFESIGTVSGLVSPRYFLPIGKGRALVTDLYADKVSIVDMAEMEVIGELPLAGWTEHLLTVGEHIYIENRTANKIQVFDRIDPGKIVKEFAFDRPLTGLAGFDNWVYVLTDDAAYQIDAIELKMKLVMVKLTSLKPFRLAVSNLSGKLYFLGKEGVYEIDPYVPLDTINEDPIPEKIIDSEGVNYYGFAIDPLSGAFYLADAKDYVQQGSVAVFDRTGKPETTFEAGIIPQHIVFLYP